MRDQAMLRLMRSSDERNLLALATEILNSTESANVFEYFADDSTTPLLLPLLSMLHAELRRMNGVAADLKSNDGVFAPWRIARRELSWSLIEPWLVTELIKCIPSHLRLLNSIYYFWLGTTEHTRQQREVSRTMVLDTCKSRLSSAEETVICNSFDPSFPWILFHLVFTADYEHPESVPYGSAADWAWLSAPLLRAAKVCPAVLVPQLIIAGNDFETRSRDVIAYRYSREFLQEWFESNLRQFLQTVVAFAPDTKHQLDANTLGYIRGAKKQSEDMLKTLQRSPDTDPNGDQSPRGK